MPVEIKKAGGLLLSRLSAVSSAQEGLTSVFGMGTGMAPPPWPPAYYVRRHPVHTLRQGLIPAGWRARLMQMVFMEATSPAGER